MIHNTFIGRSREIRLLDDYMVSGKAEFIAIYGRRRIGKTFLVKQYFDDQFDFYVTGIYDKSKGEQLLNFNRQLNKYSEALYPTVNNWFDAFAQLQHYLETLRNKEKIIVFIDELPWLDINVDVLGEAEDIDSPDKLDVKRYGVIVSTRFKRGLLLPDLDGVDTVEQQIRIAKQKAGINDNEKYSLQRFEVIRHV